MSTVDLEQFQWERLMEVLWAIHTRVEELAPKPEPGILGRLLNAYKSIEGACLNRASNHDEFHPGRLTYEFTEPALRAALEAPPQDELKATVEVMKELLADSEAARESTLNKCMELLEAKNKETLRLQSEVEALEWRLRVARFDPRAVVRTFPISDPESSDTVGIVRGHPLAFAALEAEAEQRGAEKELERIVAMLANMETAVALYAFGEEWECVLPPAEIKHLLQAGPMIFGREPK